MNKWRQVLTVVAEHNHKLLLLVELRFPGLRFRGDDGMTNIQLTGIDPVGNISDVTIYLGQELIVVYIMGDFHKE